MPTMPRPNGGPGSAGSSFGSLVGAVAPKRRFFVSKWVATGCPIDFPETPTSKAFPPFPPPSRKSQFQDRGPP